MDRNQFTSWINGASPDDVAYASKTALKRIAQLPQEHRDKFVADIGQEPAVATLFEDLKATA